MFIYMLVILGLMISAVCYEVEVIPLPNRFLFLIINSLFGLLPVVHLFIIFIQSQLVMNRYNLFVMNLIENRLIDRPEHLNPMKLFDVVLQSIEVPPPALEQKASMPGDHIKYFCPICMFFYDSILNDIHNIHYLNQNEECTRQCVVDSTSADRVF
jgi:hypothetical protein